MQADFYILKAGGKRDQLACRLLEKAYTQNLRAHLHADDAAQIAYLDALLWTFSENSFVPHDILPTADKPAPITLGFSECSTGGNILLNLSAQVPSFITAFPRIIEIAGPDEDSKQQSRQHYAFYREQGYQLNHYDI